MYEYLFVSASVLCQASDALRPALRFTFIVGTCRRQSVGRFLLMCEALPFIIFIVCFIPQRCGY